MASSPTCTASQPCAPAAGSWKLFENDDACGDWVLPLGSSGLELQVINAASAMCFVAAGAPLVWKADTAIARAYGLMMCGVGFGSFSYHATTSLSGFLIDIVPMAVTAALMLFKATHALQVDAGFVGPAAETIRFVVSMGCAYVAVYTPWAMMMAGMSHYAAWGVWALLFGSMGAAFGVVSLIMFFNEGLLSQRPGIDLFTAIGCVLLGLAFSVHSFVPGLCQGWRTVLPFHALWHLFSSITANRCGRTLDNLTKLVTAMEGSAVPLKKDKVRSLLVRLIKRDFLPSQFSM